MGCHRATDVNYFGQGTKLTVLEHDRKDATVTVFEPSPDEIKEKHCATVVCLVSDFYPDNIEITWFVDGDEREANDKSIQTDLKSISMDGNKTFSISSRLRFKKEDWVKTKTVKCEVKHYTNGSTPDIHMDMLNVKAEICGLSKEAKMQSMQTGKLTYLILICKSIFYGIFIAILAWKTKTSYSKRFD
ncbi:T cell receptor beta chain MC.7.G5-like isoform X2 [Mustelus asterias]